MGSGVLKCNNQSEVKKTLHSLLQPCDDFSLDGNIKNDLFHIILGLEKAHQLAYYEGNLTEMTPVKELATFNGLYAYYGQSESEDVLKECEIFVKHILPLMLRLVTDNSLTTEIPDDVECDKYKSPCSTQQITVYELKIPRSDISAVLSAMFLCLIPSDRENFPSADYSVFFGYLQANYWSDVQRAKLNMVLSYFKSIISNEQQLPKGLMTFRRLVGNSLPSDMSQWSAMEDALCDFEVKDTGSITDNPSEVVQTDFANMYIGGGVLNYGAVQEEIMFTVCPELQASVNFMSCMDSNEAVQMEGFESFSSYQGYHQTLEFLNSQTDAVQRDADGTPQSFVTAIDAVSYGHSTVEQYTLPHIIRDVNKAYIGFTQLTSQGGSRRPISTGNWGCGVFGGDPQLKSLMQWAAASKAECPKLYYYTFDNPRVAELPDIVKLFKGKTISSLLAVVLQYCERKSTTTCKQTLFEFLSAKLSSTN